MYGGGGGGGGGGCYLRVYGSELTLLFSFVFFFCILPVYCAKRTDSEVVSVRPSASTVFATTAHIFIAPVF